VRCLGTHTCSDFSIHFNPEIWYDLMRMATIAFDRITVDPQQCDGKPCIRSLRIPVHLILRLLARGKTPPEVIAAYPELEPPDIQQAMKYAAWLASEKTVLVTGPSK